MRSQLLFLARLGCYRHSTFDLGLSHHCLLPNLSFTPPLYADCQSKAVLPSHIRSLHWSSAPFQTKSIAHEKLNHLLMSRQIIVALSQKYIRSNTQGLALYTDHFILGKAYSTAPTEFTEKGVDLLEEEEGLKRLSTMAEGGSHREKDGEILYPAVDTYGPITIRGSELEPGKKKKWCTCGLSKKAPWCDGAHKKTGFRSLKWEVPEKPQTIYQICNCKYTKSPPFCDGTHTNLPEEVLARQKNCPNKPNHEECLKMCTGCGWKVDF